MEIEEHDNFRKISAQCDEKYLQEDFTAPMYLNVAELEIVH